MKTTHIAAAAAFAACAAGALPMVGARAEDQRNEVSWRLRALEFRASLDKEGVVRNDAFQPAVFQLKKMGVDPDTADMSSLADLRRDLAKLDLSEGGKGYARANLMTAQKLEADRKCLAEAIYYEARSESPEGQNAVAEVIANRTRSKAYPSTICGVVYQGSNLKTGCQFTFTCDGSLRKTPYGKAWDRAQRIATNVMMGMNKPVTARATHYHTVDVAPIWSASLVETKRIGSHIFYRFPTTAERKAREAEGREL